MTTLAQMIEETRSLLYAGQSEDANRLDGAVTDTATAMTFKYDLGRIQRGAIVSVDLEEVQIWETSGKVATVVQRGVGSSTPAAHSDLATVYVQPKFSNFRIMRALNQDLNDLSSPANGLYRVNSATLTFNAAVMGYDITGSTNVLGILDVDYDEPGPAKALPPINSWDLRRGESTVDFPSGNAIVFYDGGFPGKAIRVKYKSIFGQFVLTTDTHTSVGLPDTAVDLPPLGAAIRLVAPRDIKRAFVEQQGETRRPDEVPPGSSSDAMKALMMLRQQRLTAEQSRLQALYPKSLIW